MENTDFENKIKPFFWTDHETSASVCLTVGEYKTEIFETRADEGFEGGGYDWASLARVFLEEKQPEWTEVIRFDPEGSMYCAYSSDKEALKEFSLKFKEACENEKLIQDLFSRAELD
ncbi:immunity 51 family protein [Bernardetia sp.]|uniref:immunity 51 family protein n=1 Tax=Bernardetia sp. TaxID=1937974 RepID=UPI0025BC2805|nr:immunity 51 family protein [Bernardetia sp.]